MFCKQVPFIGTSCPMSETSFFMQQWGDVSVCFKNETAPYLQVKKVCKVKVCKETFGQIHSHNKEKKNLNKRATQDESKETHNCITIRKKRLVTITSPGFTLVFWSGSFYFFYLL